MRLYVKLRRDEFDRVVALALAERRTPADQAAILIAKALPFVAYAPPDEADAQGQLIGQGER
jgi:hypothetical protein